VELWEAEAEHFLKNETEFQLGFLPSEARNPLTLHLDDDFRRSTADGVRTLLACDRALLPHLRDALQRKEYQDMITAMRNARKIVFYGCGSTGRLAILLESAWNEAYPGDNRVISLMTGGDFALIRAVENFEDYPEVGKKQVADLNLAAEDMLIGITATGETAAVVGAAQEAARRGARVFMLICVPPAVPASRLERCRELYSNPNVTAIDMPIGGMAVTGSTRMQSSTIELLVAASALETASGTADISYFDAFEQLLNSLGTRESVAAIADFIDFEFGVYQKHGVIDYLPNDLLIDILSDTTERSPTFMIPPYKSVLDELSPEPWAMGRDPSASTPEVWEKCLHRSPRCVEWTQAEYVAGGLEVLLKNGTPHITTKDLMNIPIGGAPLARRAGAVQVMIHNDPTGTLIVGGRRIGERPVGTPLRLMEHVRMKLVMNLISTGVMVKYGRVKSNYMIHLAISNKKLVDRAIRIISDLCGITYENACRELFRTRHELKEKNISPVAATIRRILGELNA